MTKTEIYNHGFYCGENNTGSFDKAWHAYSTEEWDAFEVWHEGWNSGHEYALNIARENAYQEEKFLHQEDYEEWAEMVNG